MFRGQHHEESIRRLLRILENFSHSLRLAICLPLIFKEENILRILKPTEQRLFQEIYNSYNFLQQNSKRDFLEDELSRVDPKLTLLLEILSNYPEINKLTEKLLKNVSPTLKTFFEYVKQFNEIVEERIRTTPEEEGKYKLKLRNASATLEKSKNELEPLKNALEEQRKKHLKFMKEISDEIDKYESIIKNTQTKHDESIKKIIKNSESKMVETYLEMKEKQENLQNQIKIYKKELEVLTEKHAKREKILYDTHARSEKKLMISLMKYDTDIDALHQTKEELTTNLNDLKIEYNNLKEAFGTQAIFYTMLKEEKEEALLRAFAEKMGNFSKNRAAKIIQRAWKNYIARMALKKKKKSRKK